MLLLSSGLMEYATAWRSTVFTVKLPLSLTPVPFWYVTRSTVFPLMQ